MTAFNTWDTISLSSLQTHDSVQHLGHNLIVIPANTRQRSTPGTQSHCHPCKHMTAFNTWDTISSSSLQTHDSFQHLGHNLIVIPANTRQRSTPGTQSHCHPCKYTTVFNTWDTISLSSLQTHDSVQHLGHNLIVIPANTRQRSTPGTQSHRHPCKHTTAFNTWDTISSSSLQTHDSVQHLGHNLIVIPANTRQRSTPGTQSHRHPCKHMTAFNTWDTISSSSLQTHDSIQHLGHNLIVIPANT